MLEAFSNLSKADPHTSNFVTSISSLGYAANLSQSGFRMSNLIHVRFFFFFVNTSDELGLQQSPFGRFGLKFLKLKNPILNVTHRADKTIKRGWNTHIPSFKFFLKKKIPQIIPIISVFVNLGL